MEPERLMIAARLSVVPQYGTQPLTKCAGAVSASGRAMVDRLFGCDTQPLITRSGWQADNSRTVATTKALRVRKATEWTLVRQSRERIAASNAVEPTEVVVEPTEVVERTKVIVEIVGSVAVGKVVRCVGLVEVVVECGAEVVSAVECVDCELVR